LQYGSQYWQSHMDWLDLRAAAGTPFEG